MHAKYFPPLLTIVCTSAVANEQSAATSTGGLLQVLLVLVLVLGLMFGAAWLLKQFNARGTTPGSAIKIKGGVAVGNRERIMLIEVADQWIVVGVTANSINALSTMPKQETADQAEESTVSANFAHKLRQFIETRNGK